MLELYTLFMALDAIADHPVETDWGLVVFSDGMGRIMEYNYDDPSGDSAQICVLDWDSIDEGIEMLEVELWKIRHD